MDIFERIKKDKGPLGQYAETSEGYYIFPKLEGELGHRMYFHGEEVIMWSINDYLGLANHPEVRAVDGKATTDWGMAYPMGSRMMSGNTVEHEEFEVELADFVKKESALVVNFGYQGVVSAIDCLVSRRDVIVYDADCHACIVDGVRLHSGKRFSFQHNDVVSLEKRLMSAQKIANEQEGGILVITEGVFGMQGEQGKLREIASLKEKYNFRLFIDDAHGFGTLGKNGSGTGIEQDIQDEVDVYFATFAKSMGSIGAFFAGDANIVQYLKYNMRSQIFAKSMPIAQVIGNRKRLDLIRNDDSFKQKLWKNVNMLQDGLRDAGFDIGKTNSCVTPVFMHGSVVEATTLVMDLRQNHKIFCSIVVYPVIPKGKILLRLIPTASHTKEDISETLKAFKQIKSKLEKGVYKVKEIVKPL